MYVYIYIYRYIYIYIERDIDIDIDNRPSSTGGPPSTPGSAGLSGEGSRSICTCICA